MSYTSPLKDLFTLTQIQLPWATLTAIQHLYLASINAQTANKSTNFVGLYRRLPVSLLQSSSWGKWRCSLLRRIVQPYPYKQRTR